MPSASSARCGASAAPRGSPRCQHQCIYCDSRSLCYGIDDVTDVQVKAHALEHLADELPRQRVRGTIGTGSMDDPYVPLEAEVCLTRGALEIIAAHRFPAHVITESDLVVRDADLLARLGQVYAAVSFTVTVSAADDELSRLVEPGAPPTSRGLAGLQALAARGVLTGVTLRDRQRAYFQARLDEAFPGLRREYERRYGDQCYCPPPAARRLQQVFQEACREHGLATRMPLFAADASAPFSLL